MSQRNIDVIEHREHGIETCSVLEVLNRISSKWAIGILLRANDGPVRFTELERSIPGISRRMLTLTLRNLERDGLLARKVYPTVPPRVEYQATQLARELHEPLRALTAWAERHRPQIAAARAAYDHPGSQATEPLDGPVPE